MCPLTGPCPARPSGPPDRSYGESDFGQPSGTQLMTSTCCDTPRWEIVVGVYPTVDIAVEAALGPTGETSAADPHPPPMGDRGIPHPPADSDTDSDDLVADGRDAQ
jgi:hypothetical protein